MAATVALTDCTSQQTSRLQDLTFIYSLRKRMKIASEELALVPVSVSYWKRRIRRSSDVFTQQGQLQGYLLLKEAEICQPVTGFNVFQMLPPHNFLSSLKHLKQVCVTLESWMSNFNFCIANVDSLW